MKIQRLVISFLGVALLLGWAVPAAAHAVLVSSSPEPGATVTSPETVSLTFDDALLDIGASITVLDAEGVDHAAGAAYFPEPNTIRVDVLPLDPGAYSAQWRVVADDGHPIEGTLAFTVIAPEAAPEPSTSPTTGAVLSSQPPPTGPVAAPSGPGANEAPARVYLTFAAVLAAIALVAIAVFFTRPKDAATGSRRRRGPR